MQIRIGNYTTEPGARTYVMAFVLLFATISPVVPIPAKVAILSVCALLLLPHAMRRQNTDLTLLAAFAAVTAYALLVDWLSLRGHVGSPTNSMYYMPFGLVVGLVIARAFSIDTFMGCLENITFWMTVAGLVLFAFAMASPGLADRLPGYQVEDALNHTAYVVNFIYADGFLMHRFTGFASEPGVMQMLLNLSLYYSLKKGRAAFHPRHLIYVAGIVTGASTAGFVVFAVIVFLFASGARRLFAAVAFAVALPLLTPLIQYQLDNKSVGSTSFDARWQPSANAWQIIKDRPSGIGSVEYTERLRNYDIGSFDSFTQAGMRYGIQGAILLLFCLFIVARMNLGIGLILALSFLTNSFWYLPVFSCFYFWATQPRRRPQRHAARTQRRYAAIG